MEAPLGQSSGEIESPTGDYFDWNPDGSPFSIRMHVNAIDGIVRHVRAASAVEVGKPRSESDTQLAQEIDPHEQGQSSGIAAGQDPYFE